MQIDQRGQLKQLRTGRYYVEKQELLQEFKQNPIRSVLILACEALLELLLEAMEVGRYSRQFSNINGKWKAFRGNISYNKN